MTRLRRVSRVPLAIGVACALAFAAPRCATAAPAEGSAPPELVPPRLAGAASGGEGAPERGGRRLPEGAHGDAVVIVEVVVDRNGAVASSRVIEGRSPFAARALEASQAGPSSQRAAALDVAARVRLRVAFQEPPRAVDARRRRRRPRRHLRRGVGEAEGAVDEVQVRARAGSREGDPRERRGPSDARGVRRRISDAGGPPGRDPHRQRSAVLLRPRRAPGNTGYYLDGVRLPLLYHVAAGPSVVHPGLLDHVDFYPGGFPARFGRFTGGILAGATRAPATALRGEWNVRLLDAGLLVETPIAQGRGSVLAGGRYAYPGLVLSAIAPEVKLAYWDYQTRASWKPTDRDTVSAFFFGSYDDLARRRPIGGGERVEEPIFNAEFHRLDLRYDRALGSTGNARLALMLGSDRSGGDGGDATNKLVGLRTEIEDRLGPDVRGRVGADVLLEHYDLFDTDGDRLRPRDGAAAVLYAPRNDVTLGAYADVAWRVTPRFEVTPASARTSSPRGGSVTPTRRPAPSTRSASSTIRRRRPGVDPRLAARVLVAPGLTWVSALGVAHQPPSLPVPVAGVNISRLRDGLQTSIQIGQGVEVALPLDFTLTATGFLHTYLGMTDATATCIGSDGGDLADYEASIDDSCLAQRVNGRAVGVELWLKRSLSKRLTGWVSYTLSRPTRVTNAVAQHRVDGVLRPRPLLMEILGEFDRPHVLNVVGAYDLGRGFRAGARFMTYSGRPYSPRRYFGVALPPFNTERMPAFHRLDVRLEKVLSAGPKGRVSLVLEGLNVTLAKEVLSVKCQREGGLAFSALDACSFGTSARSRARAWGSRGAFEAGHLDAPRDAEVLEPLAHLAGRRDLGQARVSAVPQLEQDAVVVHHHAADLRPSPFADPRDAQCHQVARLDPVGVEEHAAHVRPQHRADRADEEDERERQGADRPLAVALHHERVEARAGGRVRAQDPQEPDHRDAEVDERGEPHAERWPEHEARARLEVVGHPEPGDGAVHLRDADPLLLLGGRALLGGIGGVRGAGEARSVEVGGGHGEHSERDTVPPRRLGCRSLNGRSAAWSASGAARRPRSSRG